MALVSVLMAAYNHEAYVAQAIESVANQTHKDVELLILDDGSHDRTPEICAGYAAKHPWIRFESQENRGVCETLNRLMADARGEFIAFIASDDMFEPEKLERQLEFLRERPEIGAVFSFVHPMDAEGTIDRERSKENGFNVHWTEDGLLSAMLMGNRLCATTCLMRKPLVDELGIFDVDLPMVHDYDYWLRALAVTRLAIVPEYLTRYRIHGNNLSAIHPQRSNDQTWQVLERHLPILLTTFPDNYAHLRQIYLHIANLAYAAKSWKDAARFLEEYCEWFGQGDEERMHLLIARVELGEKDAARELAAEMAQRKIELRPEIRTLVTRLDNWLQGA